MLETVIIGAGSIGVGFLISLFGGYRLGLARAARKWESNGAPRIGRGLATTASLCGLLMVMGGAAYCTLLIKLPDPTLGIRIGIAAGAAVVALLISMFATAKLADRVELRALIRPPTRFRPTSSGERRVGAGQPGDVGPQNVSDPVVPPTARGGWVYRDAGGAWYLALSAGAGFRLVSLPDFRLIPVGLVKPPLTTAGSVELAVWPLSEEPGAPESEVSSTAT
ncbi:MAG: hypothetical protein ACRDT8_14610 [Micromonosporaceae bacterium]